MQPHSAVMSISKPLKVNAWTMKHHHLSQNKQNASQAAVLNVQTQQNHMINKATFLKMFLKETLILANAVVLKQLWDKVLKGHKTMGDFKTYGQPSFLNLSVFSLGIFGSKSDTLFWSV